MRGALRLLAAAGLALLVGASENPSIPAPARDLAERIRGAVERGDLDPARADLYRLYAVVAADRLPPEYREDLSPDPTGYRAGAPGGPPVNRCGTPILRLVRSRLHTMPPDLRAEAERLLAPPRILARGPERVAGKTVTHALTNWIVTANFSIEWGPNLTNRDGTRPLWDSNGNGIPDVAEEWADYFEASYAEEIVNRGFTDPTIAAHLIPVYIGNSAPSTTLEDIAVGTYAYTSPGQAIPYIVVNNNLSFVPANQDPEGRIPGAMKVTAAHELFHVVHFLYEPSSWVPSEDDWWFEASSVWMEDEVFDWVNDYYQYFKTPGGWASFAEYGLPVRSDDTHYVARAYGSVIFPKYLSEHVGGKASMQDLWQDFIRPPSGLRILPALEAYATARGFEGLNELFVGFSTANAVMDYREGAAYGTVPIRKHALAANSSAEGLPLPSYLGATYLSQGAVSGAQRLSLAGNPATAWGLGALLRKPAGFGLALGAVASSGSTSLSVGFDPGDTAYAAVSFLTASASTPPSGDGGGSSGGGGGGCFVNALDARAGEGPQRAAAVATGSSYVTGLAVDPTPDTSPPGGVTAGVPTAGPGGYRISWSPATDDRGVAGYVLGWGRTNPAGPMSYRTFFGPVTSAEISGLQGSVSYQIQIFAYDGFGNEGPSTTTSVVTLPSLSKVVPAAAILEVHLSP